MTNEVSDRRQLANVALRAKENLGLRRAEVLADGGYCTGAEIKQCVDHQLTPYVPASSTSNNLKLGLFDKRHFHYDATKDVYVCPAGAELTYRFRRQENGRALSYYRARGCPRVVRSRHSACATRVSGRSRASPMMT